MDVNTSYWECLNSLSSVSSFKEQADIFRYFAHLDACDKVNTLVQRFTNDANSKLNANNLLTIEKYNNQCQSLVTPFLFQSPLFPCKDFSERQYLNSLFSNWNPNEYCIDFYRKLKISLGIGTN
jgi:hypothetical protein